MVIRGLAGDRRRRSSLGDGHQSRKNLVALWLRLVDPDGEDDSLILVPGGPVQNAVCDGQWRANGMEENQRLWPSRHSVQGHNTFPGWDKDASVGRRWLQQLSARPVLPLKAACCSIQGVERDIFSCIIIVGADVDLTIGQQRCSRRPTFRSVFPVIHAGRQVHRVEAAGCRNEVGGSSAIRGRRTICPVFRIFGSALRILESMAKGSYYRCTKRKCCLHIPPRRC